MIPSSQFFLVLVTLATFLPNPQISSAESAPDPRPSSPRLEPVDHRKEKQPDGAKKRREASGAPARELEEMRRAVADLKRKIEQLCDERHQLKLRIEAGNLAGAELEKQLAECLKHGADSKRLEQELAEARALAEREHQQAEKISAQILKQVERQRTIADELRQTVELLTREREALLAELEAHPKENQEETRQLITENKKLSEALKKAMARAREGEKRQAENQRAIDALKAKNDSVQAVRERLLQAMNDRRVLEQRAKAIEEELASAAASRAELNQHLETLTERARTAEQKAQQHRAEAEREKALRKKLEAQVEQAAATARAEAAAARKRAAEEQERAAALERQRSAEARLLDIEPIYFGKNRAASETQEQSLLTQIKQIHQKFPDARFIISGHTCTDGSHALNLTLSHCRAQRIADLLKKNGIPESAIVGVVGKGEADPVGDNATQSGREENRRVEIKVLRE